LPPYKNNNFALSEAFFPISKEGMKETPQKLKMSNHIKITIIKNESSEN